VVAVSFYLIFMVARKVARNLISHENGTWLTNLLLALHLGYSSVKLLFVARCAFRVITIHL
jgi:hypothetical protein